MPVPAPPIITCPQWGARRPKQRPTLTGRPQRIIVHHTDGHSPFVPPLTNDPRRAAVGYAQQLQNDMMDRRDWNDSGHNFLVMRSGLIVQGRWGTVTALEHGRMVVSAHCPGENDQPGIEHEHLPGEQLTAMQWTATVWLQAWICDRTGIRPTQLHGHREFYGTDCPDNLEQRLLELRLAVASKLTAGGARRRGRLGPVTVARFAGVGARPV